MYGDGKVVWWCCVYAEFLCGPDLPFSKLWRRRRTTPMEEICRMVLTVSGPVTRLIHIKEVWPCLRKLRFLRMLLMLRDFVRKKEESWNTPGSCGRTIRLVSRHPCDRARNFKGMGEPSDWCFNIRVTGPVSYGVDSYGLVNVLVVTSWMVDTYLGLLRWILW